MISTGAKGGLLQRLYAQFVFQGDFGQSIVRVCQSFLDVSDCGRVLCHLLTPAFTLFFLDKLIKHFHIADTGEVKNLKSVGKVVIFLLWLLIFVARLRLC